MASIRSGIVLEAALDQSTMTPNDFRLSLQRTILRRLDDQVANHGGPFDKPGTAKKFLQTLRKDRQSDGVTIKKKSSTGSRPTNADLAYMQNVWSGLVKHVEDGVDHASTASKLLLANGSTVIKTDYKSYLGWTAESGWATANDTSELVSDSTKKSAKSQEVAAIEPDASTQQTENGHPSSKRDSSLPTPAVQSNRQQAPISGTPAKADAPCVDPAAADQSSEITAPNAPRPAQAPALVAGQDPRSNSRATNEDVHASHPKVAGERAIATDATISSRARKHSRGEDEEEREAGDAARATKRHRAEGQGEAGLPITSNRHGAHRLNARRERLQNQINQLRSRHVRSTPHLPGLPAQLPQTLPHIEDATVPAFVLQSWWGELLEDLKFAVTRIVRLLHLDPSRALPLRFDDDGLPDRELELMLSFGQRCGARPKTLRARDGVMALIASAIDDVVFANDLKLANGRTIASIANMVEADDEHADAMLETLRLGLMAELKSSQWRNYDSQRIASDLAGEIIARIPENLVVLTEGDRDLMDATEELLHGPLKEAVDIKAHLQATGREYRLVWPAIKPMEVSIGPERLKQDGQSLVDDRASYEEIIVDYPVLPQLALETTGSGLSLIANSFCSSRRIDELEPKEKAETLKELDRRYPPDPDEDEDETAQDAEQHQTGQQQIEQHRRPQEAEGLRSREHVTGEQHHEDTEQRDNEAATLHGPESPRVAPAIRDEDSNTKYAGPLASIEPSDGEEDAFSEEESAQNQNGNSTANEFHHSSLYGSFYDLLGHGFRPDMQRHIAGGFASRSSSSGSTEYAFDDDSELPEGLRHDVKFTGNGFAQTKKTRDSSVPNPSTKRKASEYEEDDGDLDSQDASSRKRPRTAGVLDESAAKGTFENGPSRIGNQSSRVIEEYDYEDDEEEDQEQDDGDKQAGKQQVQITSSKFPMDLGEASGGLDNGASAASAQVVSAPPASGGNDRGQKAPSLPADATLASAQAPPAAAPLNRFATITTTTLPSSVDRARRREVRRKTAPDEEDDTDSEDEDEHELDDGDGDNGADGDNSDTEANKWRARAVRRQW